MINLLPASEKNRLCQEKNRQIVLILGFLSFFWLLSFAFLMIVISIRIASEVERQEIFLSIEEKSIKNEQLALAEKEIDEINKKALAVGDFYVNQVFAGDIIEKVSQDLPEKIHLTGFYFQKESRTVSLSGFAENREDLLVLKGNLEKLKDFSDVYFPPASWVRAKDINFQVSFSF